MKRSSTSQTWPRYQPQSPDSQQHGPLADYVQRVQTYYGCLPLLNLGSAFQPPAKSERDHRVDHTHFHNHESVPLQDTHHFIDLHHISPLVISFSDWRILTLKNHSLQGSNYWYLIILAVLLWTFSISTTLLEMGELELCTRYRHVMDLDVMTIFSVPLVTIPLYYYFYLCLAQMFSQVCLL